MGIMHLTSRVRAGAAPLLAGLLGALLGACRSTPTSFHVRGHEIRPQTYALVLLRTGEDPPELRDAALQKAFAGHFEHMGALAADGHLLLAGPFGDDKAQGDLRGVFLVDADGDVERAAALAAKDPTTALGVFRQEVFPLVTLDAVRFLPEMDTAAQAAARAAGAPPDEPVLRSYCVLMADDGEGVARLLGTEALATKVVLVGRLGGARDGGLFAVLDLERPGLVRPYLTVANDGRPAPAVEVSQWFATPALAKLAKDGPPPAEGYEEPAPAP